MEFAEIIQHMAYEKKLVIRLALHVNQVNLK